MKAMALHETHRALEAEQRSPLAPAEGEAVVDLRAAALNRRDYWITEGKYPDIRLPVVLGSDGAGVVVSVGDGVPASWVGAEVLINPALHWGEHQHAQGDGFEILGMPRDGTFAEQVAVPIANLHRKPPHLDWPEAAALPLAGLTAYRAVRRQGRVEAGMRVLVTGIGGGVATMALQFAKLLGASVYVTSSCPQKLARAMELGAEAGFDYRQSDWAAQLQWTLRNPLDVVIDGAAGQGYARLIDVVGFGGRIVNYGATAGMPEKLDMFKVFWKQLSLQGSTMGSPEDFHDMLTLVEQAELRPVIDQVYPLDQASLALQRMARGDQFGKLVLAIR